METSNWRAHEILGPGVSDDAIRALEAELQLALPRDYVQFLKEYDGVLFDDGLLVYGADSLVDMNNAVQLQSKVPGHVAIGDDSGGRNVVVALDSGAVFWMDKGYVRLKGLEPLSPSLAQWLADGLPMGDDD